MVIFLLTLADGSEGYIETRPSVNIDSDDMRFTAH